MQWHQYGEQNHLHLVSVNSSAVFHAYRQLTASRQLIIDFLLEKEHWLSR
jgi:hypothetical protein